MKSVFDELKTHPIANLFGLFVVFLFVVWPFLGFLTEKIISKPAYQLLILLCIAAVGLYIFDKGKIKLPHYIVFLLLFVIYTILQDVFIVRKQFGFSYVRGNFILGSVLVLILLNELNIPGLYFKFITKINLYVIYVAFIVIVIQQFYSPTFFTSASTRNVFYLASDLEQRLPSIYSWIGPTAIMGLSMFPILGLLIEEDLQKGNKRYILLLSIGLIASFFNKSRFMMLNHLILFLLIPIHKGFDMDKIVKYIALFIALSGSLYFGSKVVGYDIDRVINNRILEKERGGVIAGAAGTRILAFEVFAKLFPENPVFGKGKFHSFGRGEDASKDISLVRMLHGRSSQIHVGYLALFYYYGLIGGGLFMLFIGSLSLKMYKDAKKTGKYAPFLGIVMFLVTNLTGVWLQIFIMGIVLCIFQNEYNISVYQKKQIISRVQS